jgi:hypothetical protein
LVSFWAGKSPMTSRWTEIPDPTGIDPLALTIYRYVS